VKLLTKIFNIVNIYPIESYKTILICACGLVETLQSPGPFTVFAPTDDAFAKLTPNTVDALLAGSPELCAILTYHVVPGKFMAETIMTLNGQNLKTVNGTEITITVDADGVKVSYLYHQCRTSLLRLHSHHLHLSSSFL
jgi:uncharacterized surface protein with fasciclin (FAS1) repeats